MVGPMAAFPSETITSSFFQRSTHGSFIAFANSPFVAHIHHIITRQDGCLGRLLRQTKTDRHRIAHRLDPRPGRQPNSTTDFHNTHRRRCWLLHHIAFILRPFRASPASWPQPRHARLPHPRRRCPLRSTRKPVITPIARLVRRSLLRNRRHISLRADARRRMGTTRRSIKTALNSTSQAQTQLRAEQHNEKRTLPREQRRCGGDDVQWNQQHNWILPRET